MLRGKVYYKVYTHVHGIYRSTDSRKKTVEFRRENSPCQPQTWKKCKNIFLIFYFFFNLYAHYIRSAENSMQVSFLCLIILIAPKTVF